jgi:hypothetical protein
MKILFDLRRPYYLEGYLDVIERLLERGEHVCVSPMQRIWDEKFELYFRENALRVPLLKSEEALKEPWDIVLLSGEKFDRVYSPSQKLGYLLHGAACNGFKPTSFPLQAFSSSKMDAYFARSENDLKLGERFFPGIWENKITRIIGWPKLDCLVRGEIDGRSFLEHLGLPTDRATVVVTSHWTPDSLFRSCGLALLMELARWPYVNVIVHTHPMAMDEAPRALRDKLPQIIAELCDYEHMRFCPKSSVTDLLAAGDIFICDYSSIRCEISAINKVFISCLYPDFQSCDPELDHLLKNAAYQLNKPSELLPLLRQIEHEGCAEEKKTAMQAVTDYCFAHLGCSAEVTADAILEACRESVKKDGSQS